MVSYIRKPGLEGKNIRIVIKREADVIPAFFKPDLQVSPRLILQNTHQGFVV